MHGRVSVLERQQCDQHRAVVPRRKAARLVTTEVPVRHAGIRVVAIATALLALWFGAADARTPLGFAISGNGIRQPREGSRYTELNNAGLDFLFTNDANTVDSAKVAAETMSGLGQTVTGFTMRDIGLIDTPGSSQGKITENGCATTVPCQSAVLGTLGLADFNNTNPNFAGWFVWDEPKTANDFANIQAMLHMVNTYSSSTEKTPLVTLLPITGMDQLESNLCSPTVYGNSAATAWPNFATSYQCYLNKFIDQCNQSEPPPVLAVDHYPFEGKVADRDPTKFREFNDYFLGLRVERDVVAARNTSTWRIPMWRFIQLSPRRHDTGTGCNTDLGYPAPTIADVRWQAYGALAYGTTGISYWTVSPLDCPGWGYGDGILDASGAETALYSSVKDLNRDLHAIGNTLIDANCVAVYHQNALDQLGIDDEILGQYRQTYNIVTSVETKARDGSGHDTGNDTNEGVVAYFKNPTTGDDYLLVMNKSRTDARNIVVHFGAPPSHVKVADKSNNGVFVEQSLYDPTTFRVENVQPGDAQLLRIDDDVDEYLLQVTAIRESGTRTYYGFQNGILMVDRATGLRKTFSLPEDDNSQIWDVEVDGDDVFAVKTEIGASGVVLKLDRDLATVSTFYPYDGLPTGIARSIALTSDRVFIGLSTPADGKIALAVNRSTHALAGTIATTPLTSALDIEYEAGTSPPGIVLANQVKLARYAYSNDATSLTNVVSIKAFDAAVAADGTVYCANDSGTTKGSVSCFDALLSGKLPCWTENPLGRTRAVAVSGGRVMAVSRTSTGATIARSLNATTGAVLGQTTVQGTPMSCTISSATNDYLGTSLGTGRQTAPTDFVQPATATLSADAGCTDHIWLHWNAPGDDGTSGNAAAYDARWSTSAITEANFASATQITTLAPLAPGTLEQLKVGVSSCSAARYYALRTRDDAGNWSCVSNCVSAAPGCPSPPAQCFDSGDEVAPNAVTLVGVPGCEDHVFIRWIAPGDDRDVGQAYAYDLRSSTSTITDANFGSATQITTSTPLPPYSAEEVTAPAVCGVTRYYALKTRDQAGNWSALSTIASAAPTCPGPGQECEGDARIVAGVGDAVVELALAPVRPSPSRGLTHLGYAIPSSRAGEHFELAVFDVLGRRVAVLSEGIAQAGRHDAAWTPPSGGVYFVRMRVGTTMLRRTLIAIR